MSFETSFLSTSATNRKVAAKIANVTQSTSQSLALSNAGNSYTLSSLSASVGDTIVITFFYTDGESRGKNIVRLKQNGGSGATATIGGIYTGGTITAVQNASGTALTGLPNPTSNHTFTISTSTQALGSAVHEAVKVIGSDPGDKYQVGFSFAAASGMTSIDLQNEDDDDEESYTTTLNFPLSVSSTTPYSVTSGAISMDGVRDFLTTASNNAISMSAFYRGGSLVPTTNNSSIPASGTISLSDLYGVHKSS